MTDQELRARVDALAPWFQSIELRPGFRTVRDARFGSGGTHYPDNLYERIKPHLPARLEGKRVLDVGCNAGYMAARMKQAGAAYALAIDPEENFLAQARLVSEVLGLGLDVRKLDIIQLEASHGPFDLVLCLGVVYHLRHPILGLEALAKVARGTVVIESATLPEPRPPDPTKGQYGGRLLDCGFVEKTHSGVGGAGNWFIPSLACLESMIVAAGIGRITFSREYGGRGVVVVDATPRAGKA